MEIEDMSIESIGNYLEKRKLTDEKTWHHAITEYLKIPWEDFISVEQALGDGLKVYKGLSNGLHNANVMKLILNHNGYFWFGYEADKIGKKGYITFVIRDELTYAEAVKELGVLLPTDIRKQTKDEDKELINYYKKYVKGL